MFKTFIFTLCLHLTYLELESALSVPGNKQFLVKSFFNGRLFTPPLEDLLYCKTVILCNIWSHIWIAFSEGRVWVTGGVVACCFVFPHFSDVASCSYFLQCSLLFIDFRHFYFIAGKSWEVTPLECFNKKYVKIRTLHVQYGANVRITILLYTMNLLLAFLYKIHRKQQWHLQTKQQVWTIEWHKKIRRQANVCVLQYLVVWHFWSCLILGSSSFAFKWSGA